MPFYKDSLTAAASATGEWGDDDLGPSTSRRRFSYSKEEEGEEGDEGTTTGAVLQDVEFVKEKGEERRVGEGPAVNVFSAWASTGEADKEKILFKEGLRALKSDSGFRAKFAAFMTEQAFLRPAFFFEMPGVTASSSVKRPFEFALMGAGDGIDRREDDPVTFRLHFDRAVAMQQTIAVFPNIAGDATLVCPVPRGGGRFLDGFSWRSPAQPRYGHLAAFQRSASPAQIDSFWQTVASEALGELAGCRRRRLWLSTAGQGVAWLHFRIEGTPKYYSYGRYRDEDLGFEEGEA